VYVGASGSNILVAGLGAAGASTFTETVTATGALSGNGIGYSGAKLDVAGSFAGTLMGPGTPLTSAGGSDVFVVQFSPTCP
jgi:hypothetical protein